MSEPRRRLWTTRDEPRRFFLVPEDVELPRGSLGVRDLQLATRDVDELAVASFEVEVEEAQAHVDAGWKRVVGGVRDAWREITGQPVADEPPDLAAWLGVTPGQVALDREKRREGRRGLLERVGSLVGGIDVDRAEATLDRLGTALERDAAKLRADLARLAGTREPEGEE